MPRIRTAAAVLTGLPPRPALLPATPGGAPCWAAAQTCPASRASIPRRCAVARARDCDAGQRKTDRAPGQSAHANRAQHVCGRGKASRLAVLVRAASSALDAFSKAIKSKSYKKPARMKCVLLRCGARCVLGPPRWRFRFALAGAPGPSTAPRPYSAFAPFTLGRSGRAPNPQARRATMVL